MPYKRLGLFRFGETPQEFTKLTGIPTRAKPNNKAFSDFQDFYIRFDNDRLTQIQITENILDYQVMFNDVLVNSIQGLNTLMSRYDYIENNFRVTFLVLGMTVWKDLRTIYFFDKSLLEFWKDLERPITSW
ncbi:hypothetical protein V757_02850 [Pelistega indica]|uniref:Uncharacterized protein n=1 Tax=Pelistega indica TaxID=1414851 RepID=V8GAF1_9BURK|nr:hypothetical protein V757_02850 [Pelistega indica]